MAQSAQVVLLDIKAARAVVHVDIPRRAFHLGKTSRLPRYILPPHFPGSGLLKVACH